MIQQGGVDVQTAGGAPVTGLTFNEIPGIATGDLMLAYVLVRWVQGTDVPHVISAPFNWERITEHPAQVFGVAGIKVQIYSFHKTTLGAPYSFVWESPREAVGFLVRYYDDTGLQVRASVPRRFLNTIAAGQVYADAPSLTAILANQRLVCLHAMAGVIDTWTADPAQAEIADANCFTGSGFDISAMISDEAIAAPGASGIRTATLDAAVGGGLGCGISTLLTAGGVLLSGSSMTLDDNLKSADGVKFNPAELVLGYPNNVKQEGTTPRYKFQGINTFTLGGPSGAATTFAAKDCIIDAGTGNWTTHGSNLGSWTWEFGEKQGSGDDEVGTRPVVFLNLANKTWRGNQKFYAVLFSNQGTGNMTLAFQPQLGGLVSEMLDCIVIYEATGAGAFTLTFGSASVPFGTRKRLKVFAKSNGGTFAFSSDFCTVNEDTEIEALGFSRIMESSLANAYAMRKVVLRGNPSSAAQRWGAASNGYRVSSMRFPPGPKYAVGTSGVPTLANAQIIDALYRRAVVRDALTGLPLAGIPFKITEFVTNPLGNVLVSVVSDANGLITFGSGQTLDAVTMADFYAVATTATMRHRGPFLFEVNVGGNPAYESRTRFGDWPSDVPVTISAGNFYDVEGEVWALGPPASLPPPSPTDDVPYFEEPDVAAMLELEGQIVSVGGQDTKGILRRFTEEHLSGLWNVPILGTGVVVTIKTDSLSALAIGVDLGTDGHTYKVRETRQIGDGVLTEVLLAETV